MINRKKIIMIFLLSIFFLGCSNINKNKDAQYFLLKGINFSKQENLEKALECYKKSYETNPKDLVLLKELGYMYYKFGKYDLAEKYWFEGLDIAPCDDKIIKDLTTMYYENREFDKATKMIECSFNPNDEYLQKIKALVFYENGDIDTSYDILKKINKSNFDELTYIKYLEIVKGKESKEKYFKILQKGEELFENSKEYTLICSKELTEEFKMYEETKNILLKYLLKNGNDKDIVLMLSQIYGQLGYKQKAKDSLLLLPKL